MKKSFKLSTFLILLLSLNTYTYADDELDKLMSMSLEELLEVEITSSTHSKEDIFSVPASVTVFTYDQIRRMSVTTLSDLMNYVPGFQSNRANMLQVGKTNYTRGKYTSTGQRDVLIILDGQRLHSAWNGTAMDYNTLFSLENVEKIEFIKGPGSAIYGSNAFLGVVNITTKKDLNNVGTRFKEDYINAYMNFTYKEEDLRVSTFVKGIYDKGYEYSSQLDIYNGNYRKPKDENNGYEAYINTQYKDFTIQARHIERKSEDWYALGRSSDLSYLKTEQSFVRASYKYDEIQDYTTEFSTAYLLTKANIDFAFAPRVIGLGVEQADIEICANHPRMIIDKGLALIGVEFEGTPTPQNRLFEAMQETRSIAGGIVGSEGNETAVIINQSK